MTFSDQGDECTEPCACKEPARHCLKINDEVLIRWSDDREYHATVVQANQNRPFHKNKDGDCTIQIHFDADGSISDALNGSYFTICRHARIFLSTTYLD